MVVETLSLKNGVNFDINNDGHLNKTSWVNKEDALLVRDINSDGIINNASELFGQETIKEDGNKAKNGFEALAQLDSNSDGVINSKDDLFHELKLWKDSNSDGISQANELLTLEEIDLQEISLHTQDVSYSNNGNEVKIESTYMTSDNDNNIIADVWFNYEQNNKNETNNNELSYGTELAKRRSICIRYKNRARYLN